MTADVSQGVGAAIRNGWGVAFRGLMWSVMLVVIGLAFVAPVALVLWAAWKFARRARPETPTA